jgi:hypothetical protein
MFYAIGEIVLVVIGILIALSINNWNDYRKDRIEEKNLYKTLIRSLNNDLIDVRDKSVILKEYSLLTTLLKVSHLNILLAKSEIL